MNETPLVRSNARSNGIYSVMNKQWIKEPVAEEIPEINQEEIDAVVKEWSDRYNEIVKECNKDVGTDLKEEISNPQIEKIEKFIADIYDLRKTSIAEEGEYGSGNLIFKEIRNLGYLDNLKDLKNKLATKELCLENKDIKESMNGYLTDKELYDYRIKIQRLVFDQPVIQVNGHFAIYNVKESDYSRIVELLRRQDYIEYVRSYASGKYDFSNINYMTNMPSRYYIIEGQIKVA